MRSQDGEAPGLDPEVLHFLFAVALCNLWILANVLLGGEHQPENPPISTRIFWQLVVTDYG